MAAVAESVASFEALEGERSRVVGHLYFSTVSALLPVGEEAISAGRAAVIDLHEVTDSDSAGLALLIEWLSFAKGQNKALTYQNVPEQLHALARLSDVEELLIPAAAPLG